MFLSLIIPTRNRCELLRKALESAVNQTLDGHRFEVIVVDNGSTDATRKIVEAFDTGLHGLRYVYEERPGLHRGRHAGLRIASGDILVFADDDIRGLPTWLEGVAESFSDPSVALVGGKNLPEFECDPPAWVSRLWRYWDGGRYIGAYSVLDFGDRYRDIPPEFVWGCNFSIRKSVLLEAGGFHPDGMPPEMIRFRGDGETHVSHHVRVTGRRAVYNPKASVYHRVAKDRMAHDYLGQRARMQGISDSYTQIRSRGRPGWSIRSGARYLRARCNSVLGNFRRGEDSNRLERMQRDAYWAGFQYHQEEVSKDPGLLAWVVKENYFED